ncbi:hypothetical protein B0H67DRAFT_667302 [Lasiosphaeris hirsuta]|uniref:Uncharacterized protein n=1 Tax=Lasiosphaeris hirsuta TaxID=260670 RepID=A0AA40DSQ8_9PEZI|nr:hypothetical protein B0H67DRAFT_667302 [Lasiosphaeris hirsuta]
MSSRPLALAATVLVLATVASAAVGTMCRNQDPFLTCENSVVGTVTPRCEAYSDKSIKTSCICSTMSQITSCYVANCPRDNLNDVYDTFLNSLSCPNAPPLKTYVYTTATTETATTTPATGGAATGTSGGAASTTTSRSGARPQVVRGTTAGDVLLASIGGVFGAVTLFGVLL